MLDIKYEPAAQIVTLKVDSDISTRPEDLEDSNSGESKNSPGCIECRKDLSVKTLMRPFSSRSFLYLAMFSLITYDVSAARAVNEKIFRFTFLHPTFEVIFFIFSKVSTKKILLT